MSGKFKYGRREFLANAAASLATAELILSSSAVAETDKASVGRPLNQSPRKSAFDVLKQIDAGVLNIGYVEAGPSNGTPVILLHGWPYDIHSYVDVVPVLVKHGCRVIVPHLRGHGSTRFLKSDTPRSGQQAAIGMDVIALMDALKIKRAVLAGYDWGGRAACVAAAIWPERCMGLVSVNSYLIQDIARANVPLTAKVEAGFWYQFYFLTERGRAGLTENKSEIVRLMWTRNSPSWHFDDKTFLRSEASYNNPDYVDIVIHSYRHRLGAESGFAMYQELENKLARLPAIAVPTITLDGDADGVVAATDGKATASRFTAKREHRIIPNAGHNLPQENPDAFAQAVLALLSS